MGFTTLPFISTSRITTVVCRTIWWHMVRDTLRDFNGFPNVGPEREFSKSSISLCVYQRHYQRHTLSKLSPYFSYRPSGLLLHYLRHLTSPFRNSRVPDLDLRRESLATKSWQHSVSTMWLLSQTYPSYSNLNSLTTFGPFPWTWRWLDRVRKSVLLGFRLLWFTLDDP